jgi:hypothetical protein
MSQKKIQNLLTRVSKVIISVAKETDLNWKVESFDSLIPRAALLLMMSSMGGVQRAHSSSRGGN